MIQTSICSCSTASASTVRTVSCRRGTNRGGATAAGMRVIMSKLSTILIDDSQSFQSEIAFPDGRDPNQNAWLTITLRYSRGSVIVFW